jgi:Flp pilus assembly protein TadG
MLLLRNRKPLFMKRWSQDCSGGAAIEFAFIAPVLISAYLMLAETGGAMMMKKRATHTASAMADVTAQKDSLTNADMTNIFKIGPALLYPNGQGTDFRAVVSSIKEDDKGVMKVVWSSGHNTTGRVVGSTITNEIPADFLKSGESVIYTETSFDYKSPVGELFKNKVTMTSKAMIRPRNAAEVTRK